jgi:hypothetical protein
MIDDGYAKIISVKDDGRAVITGKMIDGVEIFLDGP